MLHLQTLGEEEPVRKNLFGSANKVLTGGPKDVFERYEAIIQRYREYAAYLKSYLC
jgi:hypothetical protein